jgi:hypothetical protein
MTLEEAYEEALRRIREAEETGAVELDLSEMKDGKVTDPALWLSNPFGVNTNT